jgi:hypothetical protein
VSELEAGRELDVLIAVKVMGWHDINGNAATTGGLLNDKREWKSLPDYSTDIAAAWAVVEYLKKRNWSWTFSHCAAAPRTEQDINEGHHHGTSAGVRRDHYGTRPFYWIYAETMPLAICRAALKAVSL